MCVRNCDRRGSEWKDTHKFLSLAVVILLEILDIFGGIGSHVGHIHPGVFAWCDIMSILSSSNNASFLRMGSIEHEGSTEGGEDDSQPDLCYDGPLSGWPVRLHAP